LAGHCVPDLSTTFSEIGYQFTAVRWHAINQLVTLRFLECVRMQPPHEVSAYLGRFEGGICPEELQHGVRVARRVPPDPPTTRCRPTSAADPIHTGWYWIFTPTNSSADIKGGGNRDLCVLRKLSNRRVGLTCEQSRGTPASIRSVDWPPAAVQAGSRVRPRIFRTRTEAGHGLIGDAGRRGNRSIGSIRKHCDQSNGGRLALG